MPPLAKPVVALFIAAAAAPARRAGEWRTVIDNRAPQIACLPVDKTLDRKSVTIDLARMSPMTCRLNGITTVGLVTSIVVQCTQPGIGVMTMKGTTVAIGPDAFASTMHSHTAYYEPDSGKRIAAPDTTMTSVARRLGPCKPGDRLTDTVDSF